jgi:hypothetical protein
MTSTDDAGSFELPVLPPGKYTAVAESFEGTSERAPLDVAEGSENELKLVLKLSKRIPFYVVSSQGPVSDAAVQVWISPGVPRSLTRTDRRPRRQHQVEVMDRLMQIPSRWTPPPGRLSSISSRLRVLSTLPSRRISCTTEPSKRPARSPVGAAAKLA